VRVVVEVGQEQGLLMVETEAVVVADYLVVQQP
jgi:hypothetical protein